MISIGRAHASNVKRWRDGQMALRDTLNKVTQIVGEPPRVRWRLVG